MIKSICFHFCDRSYLEKVKKGLQNQLRIDVPGTGIAFTIPMSSIGGKRELGFLIQGTGVCKRGGRYIERDKA